MLREERVGFRFVELVVVIVLIGMLFGLIVPSIGAPREAARRTCCASNQSQLGKAVLQYEQANGHFPGWQNYLSPANAPTTLSGTWVVSVFPYLDQTLLYEAWCSLPSDSNQPSSRSPKYRLIKVLLCPSNTPASAGVNDTPLAFAANCGHARQPYGVGGPPDDSDYFPDRGILPKNFGVFHDLCVIPDNKTAGVSDALLKQYNAKTESRQVDEEFISQHNGTSHTLMLSENVAACNYAAGVSKTTGNYAYGWAQDYRDGDARGVGFMWICSSASDADPATTNSSDIGHQTRAVGGPPDYQYARPSSFHSQGGVNCVFCDGHSQFLRKDIERIVYWHLMCPDPKHAVVCKDKDVKNVLFDGSKQFGTLTDADLY